MLKEDMNSCATQLEQPHNAHPASTTPTILPLPLFLLLRQAGQLLLQAVRLLAATPAAAAEPAVTAPLLGAPALNEGT